MPWQFRDIQLIYSWYTVDIQLIYSWYTSINPSYHKVFTRWTLFANKRWPAPWEISARLTATWIQADLGRFGRCVPEIQEALTGDWFKAGWWCNNHLEKWWSSSMGRIIPYIYIYIYTRNALTKIKKMFESTNQKGKSTRGHSHSHQNRTYSCHMSWKKQNKGRMSLQNKHPVSQKTRVPAVVALLPVISTELTPFIELECIIP